MKLHIRSFLLVFSLLTLCFGVSLSALELTAEQKTKVAEQLKNLQVLGSDPTMVAAVKAANANPPADYQDMTQAKWKVLSILSPEIKFFTKSELAAFLKSKRSALITEIFVSAANGTKVAFLAKTTSWNHTGSAKHDQTMKGKTWIGSPEEDESTGKIQVQIAFPVLDGKKAIGSVVIGLDVSKL